MDSMEDRIHKAGKYDEFQQAIERWNDSDKLKAHQQTLYDDLTACGATSEEANEYVDLMLESVQELADWTKKF